MNALDWIMGADLNAGADCMQHDWALIWTITLLRLVVAVAYCLIAYSWFVNAKRAPDTPAKKTLTNLVIMFFLSGLCGYVLPVAFIFWPLWRPYVIPLIFLTFFSYRYVFKAMHFQVVYRELASGDSVQHKVEQILQDSVGKAISTTGPSLRDQIMEALNSASVDLDTIVKVQAANAKRET